METSIRSRAAAAVDRRISAAGRRVFAVVTVDAISDGGAHYGRLRGPGTMNSGQRLRGPRRRQRIAAISAIHVARYTNGFDASSSAVVHQDPSSF